MKAVLFHGVGDIRVDDVPDPQIQDTTDAIVRLTASAICGTDLHFVRGTMAGTEPGTILGHEGTSPRSTRAIPSRCSVADRWAVRDPQREVAGGRPGAGRGRA